MTVALGLVKKEVPPAPTYKIGDYVWYDTNKNGIQDDGDSGVKGVKVTLTKPDGTTKETITDADGKYVFEGLVNGDYKVAFSNLPEDYEATVTGAGTDASLDSNGLSAEVTIADADDMTIALGLVKKEVPPAPTYKIGGYVWNDADKDGIQSLDEKGVEGIKVTLTMPNGNMKTVTTDADGKYVFEGLVNGDYKVTFSDLPEGYVPTLTGQGTSSELDSNGLNSDITIKDADNMTIDLGIVYDAQLPSTGMSQGIGYILFSLLIISIGMTLISRDRISVK
ncbi:MAG: hypothetical protein CSB16_03250 [Clostridiales bacterium]|nr:MAG: hypothetical protein CSB16_03250 [Clostridiales bacterium]